jgi:hypothetical protein
MSTSPNTGAPVSVPIGALLQALHERYGKLIGQLMQENAELQAGVEMQAGELQYLRSLQEAQREPDEGATEPVDAGTVQPAMDLLGRGAGPGDSPLEGERR